MGVSKVSRPCLPGIPRAQPRDSIVRASSVGSTARAWRDHRRRGPPSEGAARSGSRVMAGGGCIDHDQDHDHGENIYHRIPGHISGDPVLDPAQRIPGGVSEDPAQRIPLPGSQEVFQRIPFTGSQEGFQRIPLRIFLIVPQTSPEIAGRDSRSGRRLTNG